MTDELKKCPFCGGKAMLLKWDEYMATDNVFQSFAVRCRECGAFIDSWKKTEEEAARAWNRRTI